MDEFPDRLFDDDWARDAEKRAKRRYRRAAWRWRIRRVITNPLVLVLVAITAATAVWFARGGFDAGTPNNSASASALTPTLDETAKVDLTRPYGGTPAAMWREGEAGIEPPPAVPVGPYSAEQVGEFMGRVKQVILSARMDPVALEKHDPEPVLAQLAPGQADMIRQKLAPGKEADTNWLWPWITDGFHLLPVLPRIKGSMTPIINDKGELTIRTNYIVAYAFDVADPKRLRGPMDIVVVARQELEYRLIDDPKYRAGSAGIWFGPGRGHRYAVNCAQARLGLMAPSYSDPDRTPTPPSRNKEDYFNPDIPIPTENGCL
ncbi:hypothetical protein [Nocardia sp. NPDC052566]|uniref:hypothetical protein n=1 Tax=Nocardia sp. NPDC052566 TaxID=3364330 RepID=UPI0037CBFD8E